MIKLSVLRQVTAVSVPTMGMYMLTTGGQTVSILILGRVAGSTPTELGGLGMGTLIYNCLAISIGFGFTSSQDTLVSQAFGLKDFDACALYLHRCQVWMLFLAVTCGTILFWTESLLLLIQATDPETARHAGTYNRISVFGLVASFQYSALRKFLTSQKRAQPSFYVQCVTAPMHCICCVILVYRYRIWGLGLANAMKNWGDFVILAMYATLAEPVPSCKGWWCFWRALSVKQRSFQGLLEYAVLALPGVLMLMCEWWAVEILGFMVGYLRSPAQLAAHVSLGNLETMLYLIGQGTCKATAALVGAATSRRDKGQVEDVVRAAMVWNLCLGFIAGLLVVIFRAQLADIYAPQSVQTRVFIASVLPLLAAKGIAAGIFQCLQGAMFGFGLQSKTSTVSIISFWIVQMPLAWFDAFPLDLGLRGIWLAALFADMLCVLLNIKLYRSVDFAQVALAASKRLARDSSSVVGALVDGEDANKGLLNGHANNGHA